MTEEIKMLGLADRLTHYLIERSSRGLEQITVYYDESAALEAFREAEDMCPPFTTADRFCVLLSGSSLKGVMTTHGSWFDHDLGFPELASTGTEGMDDA